MATGMTMSTRPRLRLLAGVSAVVLIAGCTETGTGALFQSSDTGVSAGGSTRLVERDVEAPEVFQASEAGLWDGRPSLGGVWVAHPDVTEPERALIRNTANNKFVIGALFKPSLARPGPRFQVSSDAAEALGMLAGQPVNLNVTALRREEVPTAPVPAPQAEAPDEAAEVETAVDAPAMPAPEAVETATLDPVTDAAAAIDRAESDAVETAEAVETEAPAPKKRRWFWQKKTPEAESVTDTAVDTATDFAAAPVEQSTLPATTPQARPTPALAPKPVSTLDKPYLQIGIFSVEQNANNTAVAMRQAGMIPKVLEQSSKGKTFWRVVVGPATNAEERAALLKKAKAAGFTDAYAVTN